MKAIVLKFGVDSPLTPTLIDRMGIRVFPKDEAEEMASTLNTLHGYSGNVYLAQEIPMDQVKFPICKDVVTHPEVDELIELYQKAVEDNNYLQRYWAALSGYTPHAQEQIQKEIGRRMKDEYWGAK